MCCWFSRIRTEIWASRSCIRYIWAWKLQEHLQEKKKKSKACFVFTVLLLQFLFFSKPASRLTLEHKRERRAQNRAAKPWDNAPFFEAPFHWIALLFTARTCNSKVSLLAGCFSKRALWFSDLPYAPFGDVWFVLLMACTWSHNLGRRP